MKKAYFLNPILILLLLPITGWAQPTFSSFGSSTTTGNSSLIINGTNLTGTTSIRFGETSAKFTVNSSTQITATVPRVANTGPVRITKTSGNALSSSISVTRQSSSIVSSSIASAFGAIDIGTGSAPSFTDLDGDGLLDLLLGKQDGNIARYEQSAANSTSFSLISSTFNSIDVGLWNSPTFTDLDGDGLLDMLIGEYDGNLNHYEQSAANSTSFSLISTSFNSINVGISSSPSITDLDGDGLLDMVVGEFNGNLNHYEQNAANSTSFTLRTSSFNGIDVGDYASPTFIDLDGDGLLDLLVGEFDGNLNHYEQNAANSTSFTLINSSFNAIDVGVWSEPAFTDLDGDGLLDILVGEYDRNLNHFEQNQSPIISTLSSNSVCTGNAISITGIAFTGATVVTINGSSVGTLVGVTATNISFTVPANATSGNVVVTTPNGVSNGVAITINPNPTTPTISGIAAICSDDSTTLTTAYLLGTNEAYLWSDNSEGNSLTVSSAGTYSLQIRNIITGCTSAVSNSISVTVSTMPATPTISGSATFCFGTSTVLTSSAATGNLWSTGETTQSITVLTSGTYFVQVISGACTTNVSESVKTSIIATGTWLGVSTDWNNAANWCGGVPTTTSDVTLPSIGTLPVISGTTATCKNLTIPAGITLNIGNGANFNLAGNLSGAGNLAGVSGSSLTLNGTTNQSIPGMTVGTLVVNNSAGVTLSGTVTLIDGISLTNGILRTANNYLYFLSSASSPIESTESYIIGNLRSNARYVGTGTCSMFGVSIARGTDNLDTVMIERIESVATFNGNEGIGYIWSIRAGFQPVNGRQITLTWNPSADNNKNLSSIQVYRRPDTGGDWIKVGSEMNGSTRNVTVTTNSFSDWTISDANAPLPVTWLSFRVAPSIKGNQLNWVTSAEVNNHIFYIERSSDGKTFYTIGSVKGAGTTNTKQLYQYTDSKIGTAYYRLKQTDFDGKFVYSSTIYFDLDAKEIMLNVFPNPTSGIVNLSTSTDIYQVEIINCFGQQVLSKPANQTMDLDLSYLPKGIYTLKVIGAKATSTQKLLIQ